MRYLLLAACAALACAPARAVGFDYNVTITGAGGSNSVASTGQTSLVFFNGKNNSTYECDTGGTVLPLAILNLSVGQDVQAPDPFDGTFTVAVRISEYTNGQQGTLTFQGRLSGYVTQRAVKLAAVPVGASTRAITLGGQTFTVTMMTFNAPGPPVGSDQGALSAFVTCGPAATVTSGVSWNASTVKAGEAAQGVVTLNGPAPRGGALVTLTSTSATVLAAPVSVLVPEGSASAPFIAAARGAGNASLSAAWNNTQSTAPLTVTTAPSGGARGDVNADGSVNSADAVFLLRVLGGLASLPND